MMVPLMLSADACILTVARSVTRLGADPLISSAMRERLFITAFHNTSKEPLTVSRKNAIVIGI